MIHIDYKENLIRKEIANNPDDRIEQKKRTYYKKVIKGYLDIATNEKRVIIIEGKKPICVIQKEIIHIIKKQKKI